MYLSKAKLLLQQEYQNNQSLITNDYQKDFMLEKIRHSYQVLGVGKYLLRHEPYFAKKPSKEQNYLQAIVLLHDIGRFHEILEKQKGTPIDHGVYGAQYLSQTKDFNNIRVTLPIKHHGHLIERLLEDNEFKTLPNNQKQDILQTSFLVRDSDKLANFYLLAHSFKTVEHVFFAEYCFENPYNKEISSTVWQDFTSHQSIKRNDAHNFAEIALLFLAWIFDLNYKYSFIFLQKLHIIEKLITHFSKFWTPQQTQSIKQEIISFIANKQIFA